MKTLGIILPAAALAALVGAGGCVTAPAATPRAAATLRYGGQYDESVIRALVYSMSIYPIGSHVLLSNGAKAVVVDGNSENPRYPVVQMLGARSPDGKDIVVRTTETGIRITRSLTKEEIAALAQGAAS